MALSQTSGNSALYPVFLRVAVCFLFSCAFAAAAGAQSHFSTKANYAILLDAETKSVLFQKNPDELMAPASMSKLMTLAVVLKRIKSGALKLTDTFRVSENAWRTGGAPSGTAAMFAPLNTDITVSDLLRGMIIQSGNDACIIVAEGLSGTETAFAKVMTEEARRIGLTQSVFVNSTGLPDPGQLMTARELGLLGLHIIETYPEFYPIFKERVFEYRRHRFFNRNPLLTQNIGADGIKTGFTKESGYGMVASSVRDGRRLVAVVNGLKTKRERGAEARKLLAWGYRNFKKFTLFDADEAVSYALIWGGDKHYVKLVGDGAVKILLPRSGEHKLRASVVYQGPLKPPIKKGQQVAELRVTTANEAVTLYPLYAGEDVEEASFFMQGIDSLLYAAFGWIL